MSVSVAHVPNSLSGQRVAELGPDAALRRIVRKAILKTWRFPPTSGQIAFSIFLFSFAGKLLKKKTAISDATVDRGNFKSN
jgi:hypothetical protein